MKIYNTINCDGVNSFWNPSQFFLYNDVESPYTLPELSDGIQKL